MACSVVFAGGGTGGHVYPALSVAHELSRRIPGFRALFVGTKGGIEARVVPESGYEIRYIFSRGVRGRRATGTVVTMFALSIGVVQALQILLRFRPDLVFGAGGYASAAVMLAASLIRRRIVLQEQNSVPGLVNRKLASQADRIYLGFERAKEYFGGHRGVRITGNPLREEILAPPPADCRAAFGLDHNRPVLLVFGGSQGAHTLNRAAVDYLIGHEHIQGIIQTGEQDYDWVGRRLSGTGRRVFIAPFIDEIATAYRAADVALARAGALSVSELAAVGLPAILVPYPYAADDHQARNAQALVDSGGACMIRDGELTPTALAAVLDGLFGDPARLAAMGRSMLAAAAPDAAERIADDIEALLTGGAAGPTDSGARRET